MDKQTLSNLIEQSKKGNRKALEQLLIYAYAPVSWQCRRLLNDQQLAEEMTERILKALAGQIDRIESADHFHKWLGNVTVARCMKKREQVGIKEYIPESQDLSFPGNELSKAETAQVVQILADSLPEEYRICLLLSACCRVGTKAIAQMTGFTEEDVIKYVAEAEHGIREQMQVYQNQGVVFAGTLTIGVLLRNAMFGKPNRSAAAPMVKKVLPTVPANPVQTPKRPNNTVKILLCVVVALVLLLVLLICGIMIKNSEQEAEETTLLSTTATTAATGTTEATMEPTTEATSEPTTEPATQPAAEETTIPETTEAVETTEETEVPETTAPKTASAPGVDLGAPSEGIPKKPSSSDYNEPDDGHTHQYINMGAPGNPTCTRAGRVYVVCTLCRTGIEKADPNRPALGHDYQVNVVVAPTTSSRGYTNYRCTRCGDSYDSDYVDPLSAPETQPPVVETQASAAEAQDPASDVAE